MPLKNILILFPLEHIAFSPTTLGIYDALSVHANVTIVCPKTNAFKVDNIGNRHIEYFNLNTGKQRKIKALPLFFLAKCKKRFSGSNHFNHLKIYDFVRYLEYKKAIKKISLTKYDEIISVDILMLAIVTGLQKKSSFLSLELNDNEIPILKSINPSLIKAVVIQTQNRYNHIFGNQKHVTFFIQNAPVYKELAPCKKINNSIIFNGTATPWFGLYHALNFVKKYPDYSITFKGAISNTDSENVQLNYTYLVNNKKINFNKKYVESCDMLAFMAQYEIGFCFYDLSYPNMNTYNYRSAPSGKMFAYLAAGVPIVANNLEGLKIIEDFEAGILVNDFKPETIFEAINKIKTNYDFYNQNCIRAAKHYSFDTAVKPFTNFLIY